MSPRFTQNRRDFVRNSSMLALGIGIAGCSSTPSKEPLSKNKIPKWRGFNLLDLFSPDPERSRPKITEEDFKWMSDWGFDFVRLPMAYPYYLDIDRSRNITPEEVYNIDERRVEEVDSLVYLANKYKMHMSLNLHRAPGYCVNSGFHEPYNLWLDEEAQKAFYFHWAMWAERYKNLSRDLISFDLVNEPSQREDMNDQHSKRSPVPGDLYRKVAIGAMEAIKAVNPDHLVIADGNNVGSDIIPEITDLDIAQSCRGYYPGIISHYKASWAFKDIDNLPEPKWPGQVGDQYLSREMLEKFYEPWIGIVEQGVGVHCGECGCYNQTPHNVFLAWFEDVLDILTSHGIGYALWEFRGTFGLINSGREDVEYEDWYGQKLDRKLLNLLMKY